MDINQKYQNIISKCKFISKPDTWYVEGSEASLIDGISYRNYSDGDKFNSGWSLFRGLTNESYFGYEGELPRMDEESCQFSEFFIYDENGNEISELSLNDIIQRIRVEKIDKLDDKP